MFFFIIPSGESYCNDRSKEFSENKNIYERRAFYYGNYKKVIILQGKMRVTVICDGSLNIRRSAAWGNDNICGRAIRGQSYYVN